MRFDLDLTSGANKILNTGLPHGFGFVGGNIFPCIFAGCCAGLSAPCVPAVAPPRRSGGGLGALNAAAGVRE